MENDATLPAEDEDVSELEWFGGICREWKLELSDPREDVYTLDDGFAVNPA